MLRKCINIATLQLVLVLATSMNISAQLPSTGISSSGVLDGVYIQEHIPTKRVIQYTHLREADVMWSKRIWRTIDLREKMNHPLFYPAVPLADRMSLYDVIKYGVLEEGSLTLYDLNGTDQDDKFRYPQKAANGNINDPDYRLKLEGYFGVMETVPRMDTATDEFIYDDAGDQVFDTKPSPYETTDIIRYEIKEDWFFDKQRSVMDVRIIGISPVVFYKNPNGDILGTKNLFWLYFPECRYVFQNFFVYNTSNDAMRMSFDDLFWKRQFSSYIHQESNVFDRTVNPTWDGIEALLESDKIKQEMFKIEHDVWHL